MTAAVLINRFPERILNVHPSLLPEVCWQTLALCADPLLLQFAGGMDLNVHEAVLKAHKIESVRSVTSSNHFYMMRETL